MGAAGPEDAEVDHVLALLQSPDNGLRSQAEAQLDAWSQNPAFLTTLMARAHHAPAPGSRQLAATVLSWRLPKLWRNLAEGDGARLQAALLECYSACLEPPVLRALGEACNALCQSVAVHRDRVWEELLQLVARLISGDSKVHQRAALELLASLIDSMGARLHQHYPEIGRTLAVCIRDVDEGVRVAAFGVVGTAASSWCLGTEDLPHWQAAADATLEVAAAVLGGSAGGGGPKVLAAALRALASLAPALRSGALGGASAELACRILSAGSGIRCAEPCRAQALQVLRALARSGCPGLLPEQALGVAIPVVCRAAKDDAPSVDDLDEVSAAAQGARECLRTFARMDAGRVLPLVLEAARVAAQSPDALDRAASVHVVVFALCGAKEAQPGWAVPLSRALADATVWVRQAACEGAVLLADSLQPSPAATEGFLLLLNALAERLPIEPEPELIRKCAEAVTAIFNELTTDEAAPVLRSVVEALLRTASSTVAAAGATATAADATDGEAATTLAAASTALAAVLAALGAAAAVAADHFCSMAPAAAAALLPFLRGDAASQVPAKVLTAAVLAACIDAAGAVVASAWGDPAFQAAREELVGMALRALSSASVPTEVRASAHGFFTRVALASFEQFVPQLPHVVPAAVDALRVTDGAEMTRAGGQRRAVRTGAHEERVAAIEALGAYAAAAGQGFAAYLPNALPAICAQAQHAGSEVRVAVANALERIGRMLAGLAGGLPQGSDRAAAAAMAQAASHALCGLLSDKKLEGSGALRAALQAKEDLLECPGFAALAGPEAAAALSAAGGTQRAEDVESSSAGDDEDDLEDAN
mmetsp:Transcript_29886/g.93421  ORF Transcript_29886/g.93421 Transcript_29886/m.93421 type:complete len:825 (-) Transcript_29886:16-2490(-)